MKISRLVRRVVGAALGLGLAMVLTGCFLSPGKFDSKMDLRRNGAFTYSYKGEIYLLGLSRLASMAREAAVEEFTPSTCYDENNNWEEHDCTAAEVAEQRRSWEDSQASKKAEDERNGKALAALFGGIDPSDPAAAEEIASRLRRQRGWNSVEYTSDGVFTVDFSITSTMTHDFTFPVFEGFLLSNGFVVANLRDGNVVRIDAPGFTAQGNSTAAPSSGVLQFAAIFGEDAKSAEDRPYIPKLDGNFTITTDAVILANNTDEGPQPVAGGQQLHWKVSSRTAAAPMALIRLGN